MPARVRHARHDAFLFPFRDAAQRKPGSAFDDSLLQSDSIFAKRRRAEPLHPWFIVVENIIPPLPLPPTKKRRSMKENAGSISSRFFPFLFYSLVLISSSLNRLLLRKANHG